MLSDQGQEAFRIIGTIEFGSTASHLDQSTTPAIQAFSVSGNLVSTRFGYPLPGLKILAFFVEPENTASGLNFRMLTSFADAETLLGSATSDNNGHFQITFQDTSSVRQKLYVLTQFTDLAIVLQVVGNDDHIYYTSEALNASSRSLVVTLPIEIAGQDVTGETWATLGTRLETARITQVNLLAQQLAAVNGQTRFADWSLETRQEVLNQLEQAFLDPEHVLRQYAAPLPTLSELRTPGVLEAFQQRLQPNLQHADVQAAFTDFVGKAQSFPDLFAVDWVMDLNDLRQGNVGLAVNKFIDNYRVGIDKVTDFPLFEDDLARYRDYLRDIWPTWIMRVKYIDPQNWTQQKALDQLSNRFHQNFFTHDSTQRSANGVLIPIVTRILTTPTGTQWGFGVAPASIQPQGTRTPRAYLNYLIGLSGLSTQEFSLRYRLDCTRPDSALSSPVQENIATLQGFYRDSFQCDLEPTHVEPDVLGQPIVPDKLHGKAPFFLHYEEWLRQQAPFYAENFFDSRRTLRVEVIDVAKWRAWLQYQVKDSSPVAKPKQADWQFVSDVWDISDKLAEGDKHYYQGEYAMARDAYLNAGGLANNLAGNTFVRDFDIAGALAQRKKKTLANMKDLSSFMQPSDFGISFDYNMNEFSRNNMVLALVYYALFDIPTCLGDTYLALGDYEQSVFFYGEATRFAVGTAKETDSGGYRPELSDFNPSFLLYSIGDRPYTVNLHQEQFDQYPYPPDQNDDYQTGIINDPVRLLASKLIPNYVHPAEMRYFHLRQANAMLEWADALYRTNDVASIQRARELYKGVSFLHGETPPICPTWSSVHLLNPGFLLPLLHPFRNQNENPAFVSQKVRARKGFVQIDAGLNYYGESNDLVPPLRYRPLKETADRFAALAKAAQQDFLLYVEKMEDMIVERMKLSNLLQKAALQVDVAQEQSKIAEFNVKVAQEQVDNVKAQIAAKEKEDADASSFFSQLGDFVKGMKDTFTSLPDDTQSAVKSGVISEATGNELVGEGMLGLGAGASILAGFGIFAVAGYMSMSSMADAANRRTAELDTLRQKALTMAQALVEAKQREVKIANYQQQIAQADVDLARNLIQFEDNRFLNLNFWLNLAQIVKRILRRYLELGTRMAWLAERALAYEQDRSIHIIRLDYFADKLQGVTGADLLQADLAELEATRIEGIKHSVPVKYTFSLARDFPLQFGQLKQTGRCTFKTSELPFTLAYPGTTGYRVRAVSLLVSQVDFTNPLRGLLLNQGVSLSHPRQQDEHVLVYPAEALPISEFKLQNDMAVYSLPNETLLTFEGSGVETFWELHFPLAANTFGFAGIADVLMTLDAWAQFSPDLYTQQLTTLPTSTRRWILISGKQYQPDGIKNLAGVANPVAIDFDVNKLKLPTHEKNRKLKNVVIFFVSPSPLDVNAQFSASTPATAVSIEFKQGIAMSNIPPTITSPVPPALPLNVLGDFSVDQRFTLTIDKNLNAGVDFSGISDVIFGVEYEADLS